MADKLDPIVEVTWPYLAQEVDESLDPRLIEHHARQILARAAVHGRLVAFVGAGVSMAYGRLSWPELVFGVLEAVAHIDLDRYARDTRQKIDARQETLNTVLGLLRVHEGRFEVVRRKAQELSGDSPLLVFHLCEDALRLANEADRTREAQVRADAEAKGVAYVKGPVTQTLADVFRAQLESPQAHDSKFCRGLQAVQGTAGRQRKALRALIEAQGRRLEGRGDELGLARRYFLRALLAAAGGPEAPPRKRSQHDNGGGSPIALLLHEFRVRRYATTNYDHEIEAALAHGLRTGPRAGQAPEPTSPVDVRQQSLVLGLDTASAGLAFAIEGRRRHAQVLHLHGHIDDAQTIIASERHYQRQYLRPSSRRDLIDNTIRTLFGANPVLYVGSGITEEDVLRPLREFMSRAPRRNDTLGVALLPAIKDAHGLALQKIECLVRYGIHVIHYGHDIDEPGLRRSGTVLQTAWLHGFNETIRGMKARLEALAVPNQDDATLTERLRRAPGVTMDAAKFKLQRGMDGQAPGADAAFAIDLEADSLQALVEAWGQCRQSISTATRDLLVQWVEEIASSVTTAFVCARLKTESEFRQHWAAGLVRPIQPVRAADPMAQESEDGIYHHMTIDLAGFPGAVPNRFADEDMWNGELDKRWLKLRSNLDEHPHFLGHFGRRLLLMPVPRGAGKGSMFDQLAMPGSKPLAELQKALSKCHDATPRWRTALISFNFLSDVSNVAEAISRVIAPSPPGSPGKPAWPDNLVATLEYALHGRSPVGREVPDERVLIALGNAGVLFDSAGEPKNGQVMRLMRLLTHPRFARAPIDFVVFCDEAHVPRPFRWPTSDDAAARPGAREALARQRERRSVARTPWQADASLGERYERPNRLALRGIRMHRAAWLSLHVYPPPRNMARATAWPFMKPLFAGTDLRYVDSRIDSALHELHRAVGGNRIALTLLLAMGHEDCGISAIDDQSKSAELQRAQGSTRMLAYLDEVSTAMAVHIHESAPETAIHHVFDRWELIHLRHPGLFAAGEVAALLHGREALGNAAQQLLRLPDAAQRLWTLSKEILWHLAVLSHPVELAVLDQCPGIVQLAEAWVREALAPASDADARALASRLIGAATELCVYRCLAIRIRPRQLGAAISESERAQHKRYTVHRMVQRYFMRMMGGRNIEAIEWDQFTTSLYASQPDESPALSSAAHAKIKGLIDALCRYKVSEFMPGKPEPLDDGRSVAQEFQALRAAYFVARSAYSVGVLSHIAAQAPDSEGKPVFGHMEEYRRLVRWITHRAEKLEHLAAGQNAEAEHAGLALPHPRGPGFFHRGEIVWLYAECGVMSLTQGKLEDAESLLNLALQAARRIECDDTGSLHVRLLLHVGLTRIERGRPRSAKPMLEAIEHRREGHQVPPLIAEFYLGIIDHLGGEYHGAERRYDKALEGLRKLGRTRAAAFVLKTQADLLVAQHPDRVKQAEALAQEAIALAQRGGHEDVRMLAVLALVRIRTKGGLPHSSSDSFRLLDAVQQYGFSMGMPRLEAGAHEVRATLLLSQGETRQSALEATRSAEIAALYDLKLFKCKALLTLARILVKRDDPEQARTIVATGLEMAHAAEYFTCVRGFRALESGGGQTGLS
jgi:tetratricopeptide (TPR) repeat protein